MSKLLSFILVFITAPIFSQELNIFSARQEVLMRPLIDKFENENDIKVNIIAAKANQLINKIIQEGEFTKADILLTTDVGRLNYAKEKGIFQKITSPYIKNNLPSNLKDKDNYWFGISIRSRFFVFNKKNVRRQELNGYIDLADPKWNKRILVRSSKSVYNQSMISAMLLNYGENKVNAFLKGFVKNLARKPSGGDRDQIKAILGGMGDIALVNSYYFIKMKNDDVDNKLKNIVAYFPQDTFMKTHINISGAGVIKNSKNVNNAVKFIEFLLSNDAQKIYAEVNYEYPIRKSVELSNFMTKYSDFEMDTSNLSKIGELNKKALLMMDISGWR